jgi:hypothetical protein
MNKMLKDLLVLFLLATLPLCTTSTISTGPGTGTETTNGIMASVRYLDGRAAANIPVRIYPADYVKDTNSTLYKPYRELMTDEKGVITLDSLESGLYSVDIRNGKGEGALLNCEVIDDSLKDYGIVFLDQLSEIKGIIDTSVIDDSTDVYIQLYGLDILKKADKLTGTFNIDSIPAGCYTIRVFTSKPQQLREIINDIKVLPDKPGIIDTISIKNKSEWQNSAKIFLNTTDSGAGVPVSIIRFPVLIRLNSLNFNFTSAKSNGSDICFVKSDNTPMPFQIERWDRNLEVADIWVKVDTIYGNNKTQFFTMLWGNPDIQKISSNSTLVFDTTLGIQTSWHMDSKDSTLLADATGNRFNAKCYGLTMSSFVNGQIGRACRFDGLSSYAVVCNSSSGKLNFPVDARYTISAWVYADKLDWDLHSVISKSNHQYGLQISKENTWRFFDYHNKSGWQCSDAPAAEKMWQFVVSVHDRTKQKIYVDGTLVSEKIIVKQASDERITTDNLCIGKRTGFNTQWFNGIIDEMRIYSWPNSINWIQLCYMNQRSDDKLVMFERRFDKH